MTIKWFRYDCRPDAPKPTYGYTRPDSKEVRVVELKDGNVSRHLEFAAMAAIGMEGWTITTTQTGCDVEITLRHRKDPEKTIVICTIVQWRIEILKTFHRLGWFPDHLVLKEEYR